MPKIVIDVMAACTFLLLTIIMIAVYGLNKFHMKRILDVDTNLVSL